MNNIIIFISDINTHIFTTIMGGKMPKKKIKKSKSEWIKQKFSGLVTITSINGLEVEMTDSKGNIIIWYGQNYDTSKIKEKAELFITGTPKSYINVNDVKKTIIRNIHY